MEKQVAKALKESPVRNVLQQLMVLSDCREKKKRIKAIKNLPSLPWLIEDLRSFMCVVRGENPRLELSIKKHPRTFLRAHTKMVRGLLRVFKFHVYQLYGESRDLVVYRSLTLMDYDSSTENDNEDSVSEDSYQYSVASTESWKSSRPRTPSPFPSPFRSVFDPPRASPSPLPLAKRLKVPDQMEMIVDIVDIDEEELSQMLQRTPEEKAKVTMEEDLFFQISSSSSCDGLEREIQQEFYNMTVEFRRKVRDSGDEDTSSTGSSSFESVVVKKPFPRLQLPWDLEPVQEELLGFKQAEREQTHPAIEPVEESILPEWQPHTVPQSSPKDKTSLQHIEEPVETADHRKEGEPVPEILSPIAPPPPQETVLAPFQVFDELPTPPRQRTQQRNRRDKVNKRKTHIRHLEYLARRDREDTWHIAEPVLSSLVRPKRKVPRKYPSEYIESRVMLDSRWMTDDNHWDLTRTDGAVRDLNVEDYTGEAAAGEASDEEDWETMELDEDQTFDDIEWENLEFEAVDYMPPEIGGATTGLRDLGVEIFKLDDCMVFQDWKDKHTDPEERQFPARFRYKRAPCVSLAVCQMFPDWITRRHPDELPVQLVSESTAPHEGGAKELQTKSIDTPLAGAVMIAGSVRSQSRLTIPSQPSLLYGLAHNMMRFQVGNKETGETREFQQTDMLQDIYDFAGRNAIEISVTIPSHSGVPRVSSVRDELRIDGLAGIQELGQDGQVMPEVALPEMPLVAPEAILAAPEELEAVVDILVPLQPPGPVEEFPFVVPDVPRRPRRRRVRVHDVDDAAPRPPRRRRVRRNVPVPVVPDEMTAEPEQAEIPPLEAPAGFEAPPEPMEITEVGPVPEEPVRDVDRVWTRESVVALLQEKIRVLGTVLRFSDCCPPSVCNKRSAASFFQTLLGLWQEDLVQLRQTDPAGDPSQIFIESFDNILFQIV